jgi:anti-sigma regulatory factor (Ser/Thr protein kinase)
VVDARGTVVSCTGRAAALLGCHPDALRGHDVVELFENPGTWAVLVSGAVGGRQNTGGVVLLRPGGGTLHVRLRLTVLVPDGSHGAHLLLRMGSDADEAVTVGSGTARPRETARRVEDGAPDRARSAPTGDSAQERADLLYASAAAIGGSLDIARNAEDLAAVLVPAFADLASVDLTHAVLQGEEPTPFTGRTPLLRVAVAAVDGWPQEAYPLGATLTLGDVTGEQVRRGAAGFLADLTDVRAILAGKEERSRLLLPDAATSLLLMPVQARGLVLGAVLLWRAGERRRFDETDASLADEVASRAALSIDNARRYTKERRTAETLQRSLLPRVVSDSTAAETSGVYVPGGTPEGIGGSWFDVIELSSARVAFLVGRVPGHGLGATAAMGRLRAAVGTLADLDPPPDELLSHLDDLVVRFANTDDRDPVRAGIEGALRGASCVYVTYDPLTGRCLIASAGHPGPVLVRGSAAGSGAAAERGATGSAGAEEAGEFGAAELPPPEGLVAERVEVSAGPPLGTGGGPFEMTELRLAAGDVLAFHSDGAARRVDERDDERDKEREGAQDGGRDGTRDGAVTDRDQDDAGKRRRQAAVYEAARSAAASGRSMAATGRELLSRLSDPAPGHDQSLLLARVRELPAGRTAGWTVTADPEAVAAVRSGVTAQLAAWDLADLAFSTELIVSELVTNAIRYAGAPISVRLIKDQRLVCEVSDPSQTQPHLRRARLTDEGGRGLFLIAQLTHRWGSRYTPDGKTIWTEQLLTGH